MIGVSNGILDMHGEKRNVVWTTLASTAEVGDKTITLDEAVDWIDGEDIAIATMDFQFKSYRS